MNRAGILVWQIWPSPDGSGLLVGADRFVPIATGHDIRDLLPCVEFPPINSTQQMDYLAIRPIGLCGPDGDPEAPSAEHSAEITERIEPIVRESGGGVWAFQPANDHLEGLYGEPGPYLHIPMEVLESQVEEIRAIAPCFMIIRSDTGEPR